MFSKPAPVLGKSMLSGKDSKTLREILFAPDSCLSAVAALWCDLASSSGAPATTPASLTPLIARYLGVPSTGACSFTVEAVQGSIKTGGESSSSNNNSKPLVGLWSCSTRGANDATIPLFMSLLQDSTNPNRLGLPQVPEQLGLTLPACMRIAQLWQLVLAAACIIVPARKKGNEQQRKPETVLQRRAKKNDDDDDEDEEEEESSDDDHDDQSSSSESSSNSSSSSSKDPAASVIFHIARQLFGSTTAPNSSLLASLRFVPAVPCVQTNAVDQIVRGADLMAPGTVVHSAVAPHLQPGRPVVIVPIGHFVPIAAGVLHGHFVVPQRQQSAAAQQKTESSKNDDDDHDDASLEVDNAVNRHVFLRGRMQEHSTETRSVRVITSLGDTLWKLYDVSVAKASTLAAWTVFATTPAAGSVVALLARLAAANGSAAQQPQQQRQQKQQPPPKKGGAGGNKKPQQSQRDSSSNAPPRVLQLRTLLQESGPSPWPAGITLSTPPQIDTDPTLVFANNAAAFAEAVLCAIAESLSSCDEKNIKEDDGVAPDDDMMTASTAAAAKAPSNSVTVDDIMQAAAFHALAAVTKDMLPLPLAQFGARVQELLPRNTGAATEWAATRWKRPITFLREVAKPGKGNNSSNKSSLAAASAEQLINDWVVELVEQGPGNFVISNVNKSSRIFRDHKRADDAAHDLIRHAANNNSNDAGDDKNNNAEDEMWHSQGRIESLRPGFVSHRSGLAEDLDLVLFTNDPAAVARVVQQNSAAREKQREQQRFPDLVSASTSSAAATATAAVNPEQDENSSKQAKQFELDDFVAVDDARRKINTFARACNLVVTKQDIGSPVAAPNAKPGDFKIQGALLSLWGTTATGPPSASLDEIMHRVALQVQKGTLIRFQSGQSELRRGVPPTLQLSAKMVHNHWVTTLTGSFAYYFDINALVDVIKRKLACSARVETGVASLHQPKNTASLVLSGKHIDELVSFLGDECGIPSEFVHCQQQQQQKKK